MFVHGIVTNKQPDGGNTFFLQCHETTSCNAQEVQFKNEWGGLYVKTCLVKLLFVRNFLLLFCPDCRLWPFQVATALCQ